MRLYFNQYRNIRQKVFNPHCPSYEENLSLAWMSYTEFHRYMDKYLGPKPGPDYKLGRKKLNLGYVQGNIEWQIKYWTLRRRLQTSTLKKILHEEKN